MSPVVSGSFLESSFKHLSPNHLGVRLPGLVSLHCLPSSRPHHFVSHHVFPVGHIRVPPKLGPLEMPQKQNFRIHFHSSPTVGGDGGDRDGVQVFVSATKQLCQSSCDHAGETQIVDDLA